MKFLVVPDEIWAKLASYLLQDGVEHLAFLLGIWGGERLIVRDVFLVPDERLQQGDLGLTPDLDVLLEAMNWAVREGGVLIEAHSHPLAEGRVSFSPIDVSGQEEMAAYVKDVSPAMQYAAVVLGQDAAQARFWTTDESPKDFDGILIPGPVLHKFRGDGTPRGRFTAGVLDEAHDRQIRALGRDGHSRLTQTKVGIVGAGGLGSMVIQELAHLRVGSMVIVDDDTLEESNLSRVVSATKAAVGLPKVEIARRLVISVNPEIAVASLATNVRDGTALRALAQSDIIFGCVDNDGARLILNEFAVTHALPYIDLGVGILTDEGDLTAAGGQIVTWIPGRPCLLCSGIIDLKVAAQELESPEEQQFRRLHGYIDRLDEPEPAVVSLNGTVASLGVTEFLALVTAFRESIHFTYYDMVQQQVGRRIVKHRDHCVVCTQAGQGDRADVQRYGRRGLPSDLPL